MTTETLSEEKHPFYRDYEIYWANLSRLNGLLIIVNISMFFQGKESTLKIYGSLVHGIGVDFCDEAY